MANPPPDLGALRIDRTTPVKRKPRWRRWLVIGLIVAAVVAAVAWRYATAPVPVEVGSVSLAWPAQGYTLLNARAGVRWDDRLSISFWARNLLDKDYYELLSAAPGDVIELSNGVVYTGNAYMDFGYLIRMDSVFFLRTGRKDQGQSGGRYS